MTYLLDDFVPLGPYNRREQLHLAAAAQNTSLHWMEDNRKHLRDHDRVMGILLFVLLIAVLILADSIFAFNMPEYNQEHPLFFPIFMVFGFIGVVYSNYRYRQKNLQCYGASEAGVWIATHRGVVFHDFRDIAYFEQQRTSSDQFDVGVIRAFKTVAAGDAVLLFELTNIPNSYWRFTQLRTWQQQVQISPS